MRHHDLAVVGLGYVGLPLALTASRAGLGVVGYDLDGARVARLSEGRSHVDDISDGELTLALSTGFLPTSDPTDMGQADAFAICVPTPLTDSQPDLGHVVAAGETVGACLRPGVLVVLESTTYPGTTEEVLRPILEEASGLRAGEDFHLAYSPERIDPGNEVWTLVNTPKIVAGVDERSAQTAAALYGKFCSQVVVAKGTREAEMAKLLENTYRHVNIALVNELTVFAEELGIDIWEAIRLAATKPFGFQPFYPGPGVGGHCIPIDPSYLSHRVRRLGRPFRFVELAQEINDQMPAYVVQRAIRLLNRRGKPVKGSSILLAGVTYKPDVSDLRESPAIQVVRRLRELEPDLWYWDPHVPAFEVEGRPVTRVEDVLEAAARSDLVVILAPHQSLDLEALSDAADAVLDTRGVVPPGGGERL